MSDPELVEWDIKRLYERIDELVELNKVYENRIMALEERLDLLESMVSEAGKIE